MNFLTDRHSWSVCSFSAGEVGILQLYKIMPGQTRQTCGRPLKWCLSVQLSVDLVLCSSLTPHSALAKRGTVAGAQTWKDSDLLGMHRPPLPSGLKTSHLHFFRRDSRMTSTGVIFIVLRSKCKYGKRQDATDLISTSPEEKGAGPRAVMQSEPESLCFS